MTALHYAAEKGHLPALQLLLDRGADIEAKNKVSQTNTHILYKHTYTYIHTNIYEHIHTYKYTYIHIHNYTYTIIHIIISM